MPKILLSQNADKALYIIYKEYLFQKDTSPYKIFPINSMFHNLDNTDLMPVLIELSKAGMIGIFSDRRILLNDCAISYIEKQSKNKLNFQTNKC